MYNLMNPALNAKRSVFPAYQGDISKKTYQLARYGWHVFRRIERIQKLAPKLADAVHDEVHYGKKRRHHSD